MKDSGLVKTIDDVLENIDRRTLILTHNVENVRALIKINESKTGGIVKNVEIKTIVDFARELYAAITADNCCDTIPAYISGMEKTVIMQNIILRSIKSFDYFNNKKLMDITTVDEICSKVDLIRANGWINGKYRGTCERLTELESLVHMYEKELSECDLIDDVGLINYVCSTIDKWDEKHMLRIFDADVIMINADIKKCKDNELKMINVVQRLTHTKVCTIETGYRERKVLNAYDKDGRPFSIINGGTSFFKGYGEFNEISYVVNDIASKNIPFGNVTILYSSDEMIPALRAVLDSNEINARFVSETPITNDHFIALLLKMIEWAESDYSETKLADIFTSELMHVGDYGRTKRLMEFDFGDIGWGYKRNEMFADGMKASKCKNIKRTGEMLSRLLDVFIVNGKEIHGQEFKAADLYENIVSFLGELSLEGRDDLLLGYKKLCGLRRPFNLDKRSLACNDALAYIKELIGTLRKNESPENAAVTVRKLSAWSVLERPIAYVVGMSLVNMQGSNVESPVITDKELREEINDGEKYTVSGKERSKAENFFVTLSTFDGENISFGYSDYDTVDHRDTNPSAIYRRAIDEEGISLDEIVEFRYGDPEVSYEKCDAVDDASDEKNIFDPGIITSSTKMEAFLKCPKQFYLENVCGFAKNDYKEIDYDNWLDSKGRGSFIHKLLEEYFNKALIKKTSKSVSKTIDENALSEAVNEAEKERKKKDPLASDGLAEMESNEITDGLIKYLEHKHSELSSADERTYRPILTEKEFENYNYNIKDITGKDQKFKIKSGFIDRIDYRLDKEKKEILICVVDYKTGKADAKEAEKDTGALLQYDIYSKAINEIEELNKEIREKVAEFEDNRDIVDWYCHVNDFEYVFPSTYNDEDSKTNDSIQISKDELEGLNIKRLGLSIDAINNKGKYIDVYDLVETVKSHEDGAELLNAITSQNGAIKRVIYNCCNYCDYKALCESWKKVK